MNLKLMTLRELFHANNEIELEILSRIWIPIVIIVIIIALIRYWDYNRKYARTK
jgi:hypothetical protein